MLASPGHSPRHIKPSSPPPDVARNDAAGSVDTASAGAGALAVVSSAPHGKELARIGAMGPPPPKRPKKPQVILEEDEFVAGIERIVERDFFPDIPRLQNKMEWLEAVRSGDPEQMRQAQRTIARRNALLAATARKKTPSNQPAQNLLDPFASHPSSVRSSLPPSAAPSPALSGLGGGPSIPASPAASEASLDQWEVGSELGGRRGAWKKGEQETGALLQGGGQEGAVDLTLGLDQFLRRYTSEDNASFASIQEKDGRKRAAKHAHLLLPPGTEEAVAAATRDKLLRVEGGRGAGSSSSSMSSSSISSALVLAAAEPSGAAVEGERVAVETDGFGTSGQPLATLKQWPYTARNSLMFPAATRDDAPFSAEERQQRSMGPPKQVVSKNTRFRGSGGSSSGGGAQGSAGQAAQPSAAEEALQRYAAALPGGTPLPYVDPRGKAKKGYDLEDLRRTPAQGGTAGAVQAGEEEEEGAGGAVGMDGKLYEYVATPSPHPGVGASPLMTWGDIAATPLRLDADDEELGLSAADARGPQFQMPRRVARDEAAHALSRSAAQSLRRKREAMGGASPFGGTPSPGIGLGRSYGASPAVGGGGKRVGVAGAGSAAGGGMGMASPQVGLSPAAQRLVKSALQKRRHGAAVDGSLRASYAASPFTSPASRK